MSIDYLLSSTSNSNFMQDIKVFLAKPVLLASGNLATTNSVATALVGVNLPQDIWSASTMFTNKMSGFMGFRGTMKIKMVVNANRFQQGRYFLNYIPTGGAPYSATCTGRSVDANNNTLTARTQTFKAELDVSCDTEINMTIPYLSSMNYVPLCSLTSGSLFGQLGRLSLWAYSPLVAPTGSVVAAYNIYAWFEDVELVGPAHPQSGRLNFSSNTIKRGESLSENELDSVGKGPISSGLIRISKASNLFTDIPMISDYARGVSWLSERLSKAASIFGWAKPLNMVSTTRTLRDVMPNYGQIDAIDNSIPLSLSVKNAVGVLPGFSGTDTDEMDFNFLKTIPAWTQTLSWTTAQGTGTKIEDYGIGPLLNLNTRSVGGGPTTVYDLKPFEFLAFKFGLWRGSHTFTFKFVKTEFHSGRLCFAFFPQENYDVGSAGTYLLTQYVHREIVDIRNCNEVTFNVPYISSSPWRPCNTGAQAQIGVLEIYVVDPLVAPSSVSTTVSILVEIAGGPDLEFASPIPTQMRPVTGLTAQSGKLEFANLNPERNDCELTEGTLGGAKPVDVKGLNEVACIGESITSLRALLKMTNILPWIVAAPAAAQFFNVVPFAYTTDWYDGANIQTTTVSNDLYGALCSIYVFSRGGVRLKFLNEASALSDRPPSTYAYQASTGTAISPGTAMCSIGATDWVGNAGYGGRFATPVAYHNLKANFASEVQVPQYHKWHSRVNSCQQISFGCNYQNVLASSVFVSHFYNIGAGSTSTLGRSAADDTNFGTFKSIPPMVIMTAAQNM